MKPTILLFIFITVSLFVVACLPTPGPPEAPGAPTNTPLSLRGAPASEKISAGAARLPPLDETGPLPEIALRLTAGYLAEPTYITHAGDGSGRLFILERRGKIRVVENGRLRVEPFLDLSDIVNADNNVEQGLLGLAFHPNFPDDPRFFVYYTNWDDDTVLASCRVGPDSKQVDLDSAKILLTISQPFAVHNGGQLAFGPDGYLYVAVGEGGLDKDPGPNSLLGKILRLDVDSGGPYGIPEDNPFVDNPDYRPEIWAAGMRNPWRFSFDRATGDLYIADVGESLYEEIDFEPANSGGGQNYGWPIMEATHCYLSKPCDQTGLTMPIAEYGREGGCSVTGGYVYRGTQYPALKGFYLYGDYCTGSFWLLRPGYAPAEVLDTALNPSSFGEDEAGELYVTDFFQGNIYQVIVPGAKPQTNWPGAWPLAGEPTEPVNADYEGDIRLVGYSANQPLASPGSIVGLTLFWRGRQIPETGNIFVQVRDKDNNTVAQADHPLYLSQDVLTVDGTMLRDGATLPLPPDLPAGDYRILVGFYNPETSERLALIDDQSGENAAVLAEFVIE